MIVASVAEISPARVLDRIEEARRLGADVAEVRADYLERPELGDILSARTLPVIVTARPAWEGGRWTRSEDDRIALLREAGRGGAEYVDVEFKAYKDFDRGRASLILSWHDFEKTPEGMEAVARKMSALEPAILKIAVLARGCGDLVRLAEMQKRMDRPSAVIAMGEFGEPLRILYRRFGGMMTYARAGAETAPGQLPLAELVGLYGAKSIDDATGVYAVVGDPVAHSRGPEVFNRVFRELGLNARYVRVRLDEAAKLREVMAALEIRGASVTIPHKESALRQVDEADEIARAIGAVNTVVAEGGRLTGVNTDAPAAAEAVREAVGRRWGRGIRGERALVLGAGGAGRAIAWALRREGAEVTVANRTPERARALAASLGCESLPWERLAEARARIVVNATRLGMGGEASPYPRELWKKDAVALDFVYTPRETPFLREARAAGAETADGVEVFLRQADLQLRRFIGLAMPPELFREFLRTL